MATQEAIDDRNSTEKSVGNDLFKLGDADANRAGFQQEGAEQSDVQNVGESLDNIETKDATVTADTRNASEEPVPPDPKDFPWYSTFHSLMGEYWNIFCSTVGFPGPPPRSVENFNVDDYMGVWYEIATSATVRATFESGCMRTQAEYELITPEEGGPKYIKVTNSAVKKVSAGVVKKSGIVGRAYPVTKFVTGSDVPTLTEAKVKVMFFGKMKPPPEGSKGNYWVAALPNSGKNAIVCGPSSTSSPLWILCRTRKMTKQEYENAIEAAVAAGIPKYRLEYPLFVKTNQEELADNIVVKES